MPMIRVGLAGVGKIAENFHLPAWKDVATAKVVAVCDPRLDHARSLAESFGILNVHGSLDEMITAVDLDAIDICSPHRSHEALAISAIEAGLHCVVEKPLATTKEEAVRIVKAAKTRDVVVMCAQHQRFRPQSLVLKSLTESGDLGEIYAARVDAMSVRGVPRQFGNSFTDYSLSGGGPLMDQGAHGLDIAWWLMGCPVPVSVFATISDKTAPECGCTPDGAEWDVYSVEDFACGIVTFETGASLSLHTSYYSHCAENMFRCELLGTQGGAIWPDLLITRPAGAGVRRIMLEPEGEELASVVELRHFCDLVLGSATPTVPLEDSVTVVSMIEALYRSARTGELVRL